MDDGLMESDARWSKVAAKQNEVMERSKKLRAENQSLHKQITALEKTCKAYSCNEDKLYDILQERERLYRELLKTYRETREELDEMLAARAVTVSAKKVHKRKQPARKVKIEPK